MVRDARNCRPNTSVVSENRRDRTFFLISAVIARQKRLNWLPPPASLAPSARRSACVAQILDVLRLRETNRNVIAKSRPMPAYQPESHGGYGVSLNRPNAWSTRSLTHVHLHSIDSRRPIGTYAFRTSDVSVRIDRRSSFGRIAPLA